MRMKLTSVVLIATGVLSAQAGRAETLKLGNEGTYPPFSIVDANGKLTGVEPDLAREMCRRMNAECEIVAMDFKALIPSMLQGKLDAVVSQITPLPERKERALFTRIIVQNLYQWVVPVNSNYSFDKVGLKGVRVGLAARRRPRPVHLGQVRRRRGAGALRQSRPDPPGAAEPPHRRDLRRAQSTGRWS